MFYSLYCVAFRFYCAAAFWQRILHIKLNLIELTSTYTPNFIEIEETFCGRTDVRTHARTCVVRTYVCPFTKSGKSPSACTDGRTDGHLRPALLGRLCRRVDLKSPRLQTAKVIFKVIQWHWQWCHSIGHIRFSISLSLQLGLYLAPLTLISQNLQRSRYAEHTTFGGNISCMH